MNEELYEWEVSVGDVTIGRASTDERFNLIKIAVEQGLIAKDFSMADVKFELVKI
jgi:hypothetical protein